ncbi:hypothetical protein I4U23_016812 [Adineta vaga]|nr:hypothetical protein I4U23_016812 [Adineta vaga]
MAATTNETLFNQNTSVVDRSIAFWIYLIIFILSVISEVPLVLVNFRTNYVLIQSDTFCTIWCYIDYVFNVIILMLICYGSIERYLLVFHNHFLLRHLILFHYLPILICIIYPFLFYFGFIFFYPCVNQYDYTKITCQGPCYLFERIPGSIDLLINLTLPLSLCILTNIILFCRVIHQKHRMKQQQKWKKNRHLVMQLMSVIIIHNLVWIPIIICLLITLFAPVVEQILIDLSVNLFTYSIYIVIMVCPFTSLLGLSGLGESLIPRFLVLNRGQNTVQPAVHLPLMTISRVLHIHKSNNQSKRENILNIPNTNGQT